VDFKRGWEVRWCRENGGRERGEGCGRGRERAEGMEGKQRRSEGGVERRTEKWGRLGECGDGCGWAGINEGWNRGLDDRGKIVGDRVQRREWMI